MNNVVISRQAIDDLRNIFTALIHWHKGALEMEHALQYVADIERECYVLALRTHHTKTSYSTHKQYGAKVCKYKRNASTTWYIIYNIDIFQNIYITKIISNYNTV